MSDEVARVTVRVRRSIHRDLAAELLATGRYMRAKRLIQLAAAGLVFERAAVRNLVAEQSAANGATHAHGQTPSHGNGEICVSGHDPVAEANAGLMTTDELAELFSGKSATG